MNSLRYHECIQRGSLDFPLDYHYVTALHPRYEMTYHWHEECEILHVVKGRFSLKIDETLREMSAGDIAFIGSGSLHGGTPTDCVYECIVFDMRLLLHTNDHCRQYIRDILYGKIRVNAHFPADCKEIRHTLTPMFETLREHGDGYSLITLGCLFQFVGEVYKHGSYAEKPAHAVAEAGNTLKLKRVFEMIETRYPHELSLAQLSAAVGMSPKYFCRFFRQTTHRTPMDYVNYYRIEQACHQMDATDCNATEVAMKVGFGDLNYFIRVFKRYKGMTPGQYIRTIRDKEEKPR